MTLRAKPWLVTPRLIFTPMAAIFLSPTHTPVRPSIRPARILNPLALDIQFSFQFKASGFKILADRSLPVHRHEHRQWSELAEEEREKLSHDNFRRFLKRWEHRKDLLVVNQA